MSTATGPQNAGFTGAAGEYDTASISSLISLISGEFAETSESVSVTGKDISSVDVSQTTPTTSAFSPTSFESIASTKTNHASSTFITSGPYPSSAGPTGLPSGAKAGIGVGVALLFAFVVAAFLTFKKRRRSLRKNMAQGGHIALEKPGHTHDEQDSCVYHAKPELEDTSSPRNSSRNLLRVGLDVGGDHARDSIAELEGSQPKPNVRSEAVEIGPG